MNLFTIVKEDWIAHGRDWTLPGFRAVVVCRFGQWRMMIKNRFLRMPFSIFYRFLYRRVRNVYGIELPFTAVIGRRLVIEHQGGIVVHGHCKIGDDCIIRQGVTLGIKNLSDLRAVPTLGNGVQVGAGATIVGDIKIGDNARIGANSLVTKDVFPCVTVVGVPAKPINYKMSPVNLCSIC